MLGLHCFVGFSLVVASRGCFLAEVHKLLTEVACWALDRAQAPQSWHMSLVALRHAGSSWTRD